MFCHFFLFVKSPIRGQPSHSSLPYPHRKEPVVYVVQMKHISECMARDTMGGARKPFSVPATSAFFRKFAISLRGCCKLGLQTNEPSGWDMKFQ